MNRSSKFLAGLACVAAGVLSSCEADRTVGAAPPASPSSDGQVALSLNLGPVGVLARSLQMTPTRLVLQFNSGATAVRDTVAISGSGTVAKTYSFPAQPETLQVKGLDQRDSLLYQGSSVFLVQSGRTTSVSVSLDSRYSTLRTKFPVQDSLTRFTLTVDGRLWGDSSVAIRSRIGDTVKIDHDYLAASPSGTLHAFSLRAYGRSNGTDTVLYAADTSIAIVSGSRQGFVAYLRWVGANAGGKVALAVVLGPVPQVEILAKYLDPFQSGGDTTVVPPVVTDFGIPWNSSISYGSLYDSRDGKTYRTVKIGKQTWMAENLNYRNTNGVDDTVGVCYKNSADSCSKYGRRYLWNQAMSINAAYNSYPWNGGLPRQGICPSGWHIPVDTEWNRLMTATGGYSVAGGTLRATKGWGEYLGRTGNGTDAFGFRLLPSADPRTNAQSELIQSAVLTSATEYSSSNYYYAYDWYVDNTSAQFNYSGYIRSSTYAPLRCLSD